MKIDYSLYLVTDRGLSRGRSTLEIVKSAVRGGVTCIQLREKNYSTLEFIEEAFSIKELLSVHGIPLIINDRIDVALAVKADGIHLGQKDMPLKLAKDIVFPSMVIGISAESVEDAVIAERDGADYIGVSPVYGTLTKIDTTEPLGLEGVTAIRRSVRIPIVGIGGMNKDTCGEIIKCGADGVAVVSAIVSADNPEYAVREIMDAIRQARYYET